MRMQTFFCAAALSAAALAGCGGNDPAPTAAPAGGSATQPSAPKMSSATQPSSPVASAMDAAVAQAGPLIEQAKGYLSSGKMDLLQTALTKLQGMKSNLPANYQSDIDALQAAFDKAKAAMGGMTVPKLPGM